MVIFNALQTTLSGGIGRYSYELSKAIYQMKEVPLKIVIRKQDLQLFKFAKEEDLIIAENINSGKDRNYYEQFKLPRIIRKNYKDAIVHYPDTMAPIFSKNKVVITIHDLSFLTRAQDFTAKTRIWKKFITDKSVKKADKIINDTDFAKSEVQKYYPNCINKANTVYIGFNDFSNEEIDYSKVKDNIKLLGEKPYLLTVSTISPRKNMDGLIKAFSLIKEKIDCDLVIAGGNGWLYEKIYEEARKSGVEERIIFTGRINDEELKHLYKNCEIFVYPSFYEGFGLPPLEAMSYKKPCIVSKAASIPEVVGDAAIFINPYSEEDMAEKIMLLYKNDTLREKLIEKGEERMKKFAWDKCAKETVNIYKTLMR